MTISQSAGLSQSVLDGKEIVLKQSELAIPIVNSLELIRSNVAELTGVEDKSLVGNIGSTNNSLLTFTNTFSQLTNLDDKNTAIDLFKAELNYLGDTQNIDACVTMLKLYQNIELSSIHELPKLEEVIDFEHTDMFIAYVISQGVNVADVSSINNAIQIITDNYEIEDVLASARVLKGRDFEGQLAFEFVRLIFKDSNNETGTKEGLYRGYIKNDIPVDIYNTFIKESSSIGYQCDSLDVLSSDDPLIEILEKIYNYDEELYEMILSKINVYRTRKGESYLGLENLRNFKKESIDTQINLTPKKINKLISVELNKKIALANKYEKLGLTEDIESDNDEDIYPNQEDEEFDFDESNDVFNIDEEI